jgi:hypothetical protein
MAVSYDIDIACKGNSAEMRKMWLAVSRPKKGESEEGEERELSFEELAASAGKDMDSFVASGSVIDAGACVNFVRGEKSRTNPENFYPLLAKAFPGLRFFIVQVSFSEKSCCCASFEAKNGRMRQTGVWEDEIRESGEARRAWLGALQGHWLLERAVFDEMAAPDEPVPCEAAEGEHELARAEKQTAKMCLEAVQADGEALAYVRKQTPKLCLAAAENTGKALRFVKKQSPKICRAALGQDGLALEYVQEQTRELCLAAVKQNYLAYRYVRETSAAIYRQFMAGFMGDLERIAASR